MVIFGISALIMQFKHTHGSVDLNSVIITLFMLWNALYIGVPAAYIAAVKNAARITGSLILQYPALYGGIMGIH